MVPAPCLPVLALLRRSHTHTDSWFSLPLLFSALLLSLSLTPPWLPHSFRCASRWPSRSTDRKSLMENLAAKLAAGPPAKPVGLVKQVDHTAADAGVGAEASSAEKALGGVLTGSLADESSASAADKGTVTSEDTEGYVGGSTPIPVMSLWGCLVRGRRYMCTRGA